MSVWTLGVNHQTAPITLRERLVFDNDRLSNSLDSLYSTLKSDCSTEVALLSTCNRTEIYCATPQSIADKGLSWLAKMAKIDSRELATHAYSHQSSDAVRHAFRVASGLDSMVLGETQVLGQMKQASRAAREQGVLGTTLNHLFDRSFGVAKEVRHITRIGENHVSLPAIGVRLASQLFGQNFSKLKILFIGAGEMIALCATHFSAKSPLTMTVANRTIEKGAQIATHHGAQVMRLADLPNRLHEFDIVISCTASVLPLIGLGATNSAIKKRDGRAMFMLDLAVPRDIEPEVKSLPNIHLYSIDDLSGFAKEGQESRLVAAQEAETIVDTGVLSFMRWLDHRLVAPTVRDLLQQTQSWQKSEISKARKMLKKGSNVDEVLQSLSHRLIQKMLHGALAELSSGDLDNIARTEDAIQHFFLRSKR